MQATIKSIVISAGTGLHSGKPTRIRVLPAMVGHGIKFKRVDVKNRPNVVDASFRNVSDAQLCTKISNRRGVSVKTIEHVIAGLWICGIRNALVEVDAEEVPQMDGSAIELVDKILNAGVEYQNAPIEVIRIVKPVEHEDGPASVALAPSGKFGIDVKISFENPIGEQSKSMILCNGAPVRHLSDSRTFCTEAQYEEIRKNNLGRGGTFETVVFADRENKIYPNQIRYEDECVRHKMLDAIGDLALAGRPIVGWFSGKFSGHRHTSELLKRLFSTEGAYRLETADAETAALLPGVGACTRDLPRTSIC